jgi:hypothetical protein
MIKRFYCWFEYNAIGYLTNGILFLWMIFAIKH